MVTHCLGAIVVGNCTPLMHFTFKMYVLNLVYTLVNYCTLVPIENLVILHTSASLSSKPYGGYSMTHNALTHTACTTKLEENITSTKSKSINFLTYVIYRKLGNFQQ